MDYDKCSKFCNDLLIVLRENRSQIRISNPGKKLINKIHVDGCLITGGDERCDWIVSSCSEADNVAVYVELKGCNIDKAVAQLKATLESTKSKFCDHDRQCYAVTTRVPKHGVSMTKRKIDFYKVTGVPLNVKNMNCSISL